MAGFGEGQRMFHGLAIADLADKNDIRRLTQGVFQGCVEAAGIYPHLPLVDDALAVTMNELHRILDGNDVAAAVAVAVVDKRRQRGRFTRAGTADKQYQTAFLHDGVEQHRREFEIFKAGDFGLDVAGHQRDFVALLEDVDPKAADLGQGDGEVHLQILLELLLLLAIHDLGGDPRHFTRFQRRFVEGAQAAVKFGAGGRAGRQIEV